MRALTWQGTQKVSVEDVPDPSIIEPTDAIIKVTSTAICGSDLHLYSVLGPFLHPGDVLGHETMGVVEEVGPQVTNLRPGDRVVIPFNISCGHCWMCERGLQSQCETTQVRSQGKGAALFGYTDLYGAVPGGQAQYLRVPQAQYGPIKIESDAPDERFLYLSDILPTAWQGVEYAEVPDGGSIAVFGLGPVGLLATRIAQRKGLRVIGIDRIPERLAAAAATGVETLDLDSLDSPSPDSVGQALIERVDGRGPDATLDAVGMEAHGDALKGAAIKAVGLLPSPVAKAATDKLGIDRLAALNGAIKGVRRGGTVSVSGVYGGEVDPMPMMEMFDRQLSIRMGQCNVKRWIDDMMPSVLESGDPLGLESLATHRPGLEEAPAAYDMFQRKTDGCIKVVLKP